MTLSPRGPRVIFFFILTHILTISIFHPISPFVNIKFFTLGLALPIINPHFCTCAARSTATGPRRQDHGSWSTAALVLAGHGPQVFGQQDHGPQI